MCIIRHLSSPTSGNHHSSRHVHCVVLAYFSFKITFNNVIKWNLDHGWREFYFCCFECTTMPLHRYSSRHGHANWKFRHKQNSTQRSRKWKNKQWIYLAAHINNIQYFSLRLGPRMKESPNLCSNISLSWLAMILCAYLLHILFVRITLWAHWYNYTVYISPANHSVCMGNGYVCVCVHFTVHFGVTHWWSSDYTKKKMKLNSSNWRAASAKFMGTTYHGRRRRRKKKLGQNRISSGIATNTPTPNTMRKFPKEILSSWVFVICSRFHIFFSFYALSWTNGNNSIRSSSQ